MSLGRENAAARLLQMKPGFIKTTQVRMLVAPFQQDARAIQQILTLLAKAKRGDLAFVVLETLGQEPQQMLDVLNFNVGISTCAQCHLWQKACVLFEEARIIIAIAAVFIIVLSVVKVLVVTFFLQTPFFPKQVYL